MLPLDTMCPRYSTEVVANSYFFEFTVPLVLVEFLHDLCEHGLRVRP